MTYCLDPADYWKLRARMLALELARRDLHEAKRQSLLQWAMIQEAHGLDPDLQWAWNDERCELTRNGG